MLAAARRLRGDSGTRFARKHQALERAQRVLGHWAKDFDLAAAAHDPLSGEEIARIEQAILQGNVGVLEEYGDLQAALKRSIELKKVARKRSKKTIIEYAIRLTPVQHPGDTELVPWAKGAEIER